MVTVGDRPILWHILKCYAAHGFQEFIICLGYKGYIVKEYFANYFLHTSDVTIDLSTSGMEVHKRSGEPWKVTLVETGDASMTGGRLKRVAEYLPADEPFCMTYGDGVTDLDIGALVKNHRVSGRLATLTGVRAPGRFGALTLMDDGRVEHFDEKPIGDGAWINGGFFVLEPSVLDYIEDDATIWEQEPLYRLAREGQLNAYLYDGFWQCMDTIRDRIVLEQLWSTAKPPWAKWWP